MKTSLPPAWRRLDVRLWTAFGVLLAGLVLGLSGLAYAALVRSLQARDRAAVRAEAGEMAGDYAMGGMAALRQELAEAAHLPPGVAPYLRLRDASGRVVLDATGAAWQGYRPTLPRAPLPDGAWRRVAGRNGQPPLDLLTLALPDGHRLEVGLPSRRDETAAHFRDVLLGAGLAILLVGLALGAALARRALRPLRWLALSVAHVAGGGALDARVAPAGTGDELDALVGEYNRALDRIAALVTAMRGSLDAVAHDLRTPLARLRAAAELALGQPDDTGARDALGAVLEETEEVSALLEALLDAGEAEAGTLRLHPAPLALDTLVLDAADLFAATAEAKGVTLAVDAGPPLVVHADPRRLRQALAHLLDNAVKFTPAGGRVEVGVRLLPRGVALTVRDTGPGIAPGDLPRIWDRLFRGDPSRSERGMGLGLSLTRAIAEAHGGSVEAASTPGAGALFTLYLPRGPVQTVMQPKGA